MKKANSNLHSAKKAKNDEFYTRLTDIEKELNNYGKYFKNKVVFLNCDDPEESNFWRFFKENFDRFEMKKLIATHYENNGSSYKLEIEHDITGDGRINGDDKIPSPLKGNGDFRSDECIALLKEADIVVTNPPFSLFREYVGTLVEHKKKFIIIGSKNAITYKEIFKLIKENKLWLGYNMPPKFILPNGDTKAVGAVWFTNLNTKNRNGDINSRKEYKKNKSDYPKYDNYNAINVDKVVDIPVDYDGVMGVPITFLNKFNPEQFEIVGITDRANTSGLRTKIYTKEKVPNYSDLNARSVIKTKDGYKAMYARILIKRK